MNKKHIILPFAAALITLTGCNYNDKNFDGLKELTSPEDVVKLEYTLTDSDYATIASNSTNKKLAAEAGVGSELTALSSKLCFSDVITAEEYVPAFLAAKWYTADAGSAIKLTYNQSVDAPEYLAEIDAAETYVLTSEDYASVLDKEGIDYFYPSKPAATYLPRILRNAIANPVSGQYLAVQYSYSANDPSSSDEPTNVYNSITDAVEGPDGDYFVKGKVAATYARGFLLTDGTSTILVYENALPNVSLGDELTVKGTTSTYGGAKQFGASGLEITRLAGSDSFAYPIATEMTASDMDAYVANNTSAALKYVTYKGVLSISGNYYNVAIEGATTAIGSIAYPVNGTISPDLSGKEVVVTGYTVGVGGVKYVNTMATSVVEVGATASTPIGIVQLSDVGDYTIQGQIVATYTRGFLVNDGTGSILVYVNTDLPIGSSVLVSGTTSVYGGLKQYGNTATITSITEGNGSTTHPTPYSMTIDDVDAYAEAPYVRYVSYKGILSISGNYYNVTVDGATVVGSISNPIAGSVDAELNGKEVVVVGYSIGSTGSSTKYLNTMITSVQEASSPLSRMAYTRAADAEQIYVMYQYNGSNWVAAEGTAMVSPSDYRQMGLSNNNFSATYKPDNYIPQFLGLQYPYAQNEQTIAAVYYYYDGTTTEIASEEYTFASGTWVKNTNIEVLTDQFVYDGSVWNYDPSIVITLKKGDAYTKEFMQVTVDGVKEHIGSEYVDSYGTGEFYYGCSAYYGNVDITPAKWRPYYPSVTTDAEMSEIIAEHAKSGIFVYSLQYYHGDMDVIPGIDVTVTINYDTYNSSASAGVQQIKYLVTGKGEFEYIEDSYQTLE